MNGPFGGGEQYTGEKGHDDKPHRKVDVENFLASLILAGTVVLSNVDASGAAQPKHDRGSNHIKAVGNCDGGQRSLANAADHDVIDQIDKGGNKLLCHNGEGDSSYFFVKEFVTKKTSDVQLRHNGSFLCGKIGLNGFENTWIVKKQRIWYRKKLY